MTILCEYKNSYLSIILKLNVLMQLKVKTTGVALIYVNQQGKIQLASMQVQMRN